MPAVARYLKLEVPTRLPPPVTLEISSLLNVDSDIVDYFVDENCRAVCKLIKSLALPEGVVIALVVRGDKTILPQGRTMLVRGDHVVVVLRPDVRAMVDRVFAHCERGHQDLPLDVEFPLRGTVRAGELEQFYQIKLDDNPDSTLDELIRSRLPESQLAIGSAVQYEAVVLRIREISQSGTVEYVGMAIVPQPEAKSPTESTTSQGVGQATENAAFVNDSNEERLRALLKKPLRLSALAATEFVIERDDKLGGSGASFIVEWQAGARVNQPLVETIMIDTQGQQGISFISQAVVLSEGASESG